MIMPKYKLAHLGSCIRAARHDCKLTQQELADDCHVAIKTIQNIEKGQMNPAFDILYPIVNRIEDFKGRVHLPLPLKSSIRL